MPVHCPYLIFLVTKSGGSQIAEINWEQFYGSGSGESHPSSSIFKYLLHNLQQFIFSLRQCLISHSPISHLYSGVFWETESSVILASQKICVILLCEGSYSFYCHVKYGLLIMTCIPCCRACPPNSLITIIPKFHPTNSAKSSTHYSICQHHCGKH